MIKIPETISNFPAYQANLDYVNGEWNSPTRNKVFKTLKKAKIKTVIDIGANVGVFSDKCLNELKLEKLYGFEPDKVNYEILCTNLDNPIVELYNFGIFYGKTKGYAMGTGDGNTGGYMFSEIPLEELDIPNKENLVNYDIEFAMYPLEDYIPNPVDLIKIDVEGSEYNIIRNSSLIRKSKYLILEFHGKLPEEVDTFIKTYLPDYSILEFTSEHFNNPFLWFSFLKKN